jgi:tRNA(adenine34) deaminase
MWNELPEYWKQCFRLVWDSYKCGSFPIGAVIVNEENEIIATGRNRVYEKNHVDDEICNNKIAHAEINAILKIDNLETNENRKRYKIYSSLEPCPLCFGAIVISGIKHIHYAARDGLAGASNLKEGNDHLKSKSLHTFGPYDHLEIVQIVIITDFILRRGHDVERIIAPWREDCPLAVKIGSDWFEKNKLQKAIESNIGIDNIMNDISEEIIRLNGSARS